MRIKREKKVARLRDVTTIETTKVVKRMDKKVLSNVIQVNGKSVTIAELLDKDKETVLQSLIDCYRENRIEKFNTIARQTIFKKALTREPDLRVLAAVAALQQGKAEEALKDCVVHLNNGKYEQGYLLEGAVYAKLNCIDLAIKSLKKGLALSKGGALALRLKSNLANLYQRQGKTDLALQILTEAIIADPENSFPLLRINRASIYLDQVKYGYAFEDASEHYHTSYTAKLAAKLRGYSFRRCAASELAA